MEILKALVAGMIVGALFAYLKLPSPAPTAAAGVAGVAGIFIGAFFFSKFL